MAETALQRENIDVAIQSYSRLAKNTRDPRIAERATDIALRARRPDAAQEAVARWVNLEPNSMNARQAAAALFVSMGKLDKAKPHLEKLLSSEKSSVDKAFMHLNKLLSRHPQKAETYKLVQSLAAGYPNLPESHFAVSQAAWSNNQLDIALKEMKRALELRPDWEIAATPLISRSRSPIRAGSSSREEATIFLRRSAETLRLSGANTRMSWT